MPTQEQVHKKWSNIFTDKRKRLNNLILSVPEQVELLDDISAIRKISEVNKFLTIEEIKTTVCEYFQITVQDIESESRLTDIVLARHISMYLCRKYLRNPSFKRIGKAHGGRDHATALYAFYKIRDWYDLKDNRTFNVNNIIELL